MTLRNYQEEAIKQIEEKFKAGVQKQCIVLATGTGKTIIFSSLASDFIERTNKKVLIIAHREELLTQAQEKLERVNPLLKVGIEQAENHANPAHLDIVLASVATIGRINSERIKKLDPKEFCMVIIDECHHASADSYKTVLRYFGLLKEEPDNNWNTECLLLGVTATPSRSDNKGIDTIFDEVTFSYPIIQGIQEKYLSRIKAYRVNTYTDLRQVHKVAGDFNLGELGEAVNNEDRNGLIVKAYKAITPDKQALVFAVDVDHTKTLCARFQEEGVKTGYVIGTTPKDERAQLLSDFGNKKIQVMINAMVLTEGYDNESIDAVLIGRPTQSGILFQQMVGRGTRIFEGKEFLTVIDFVDITYKQHLVTTASLLGLKGELDFKGKDILEVKGQLDRLLELAPNADLSKLDIDKIHLAIEEVDLLSGLKTPVEIEMHTNFEWHRWGEDNYRIGLGNDHSVTVQHAITGEYQTTDDFYDRITKKETSKLIGKAKDLKTAIEGSDYYIRQQYPDQTILIRSNARWHAEPPSEAQIRLLRKFRVNDYVLGAMSKGQASRLITKLIYHERQSK